MIEEIRSTAISVTSTVFETMFFIPLVIRGEDGEEESPLSKSSVLFRGEIGFNGKVSGKLRLYLPTELAKMMVNNFMGLEEGTVLESQTMDMVNELCNMVCGNLFSQLDKKTIWDLTLPRTCSISYETMEKEMAMESSIAVGFNADGYGVRLAIQLET
jgi:CheY-specific phosphatase CheX